MAKQVQPKIAILIIVLVALAAGIAIMVASRNVDFSSLTFPRLLFPEKKPSQEITPKLEGFKRFASLSEFKDYIQRGQAEAGESYAWSGGVRMLGKAAMPTAPTAQVLEEVAGIGGGEIPERVSETNVQVAGIDEPDIVKTDGKEIYFSSEPFYYRRGLIEEMVGNILPSEIEFTTKVIKAFPPADLSQEAKIDRTGNLLLSGNILAIFSGDKIYGYDVSSPKTPVKKWQVDLENRTYVAGARLYQGKIYLITKQDVNTYQPCPVRPLSVDDVALDIKCVDIYHPAVNVPVDVTYTALVLNPVSGMVEKTVSFVGSSDYSVVYVSENALYVTYSYYGDFVKFIYNFYQEKCQDIIPDAVLNKLEKLMEYDISSSAKFTELGILLDNFFRTLSDDERVRVENELNNRMASFYKEHSRELGKTGIVKITLKELEVASLGNVPGKPLNQFSLDEYQGYVRIATTIGDRGWRMFWQGGESANDVYILDSDLKITGSVKDLGLGERIYSVRFLQDKGYVVTFRETDPFYVLDLSDPKAPEKKGELKIPGYSSYLHPITKDKILGIGKEGQNVKISLFDVADPAQPTEKAKYNLDEYWSEILNNYHGFLLDSKHQIFFLPGSKGGYVFSYQGDELKLQRVVSGISAKRAIYINDYLYIIGDDQITVLNELDWQKVNELEF